MTLGASAFGLMAGQEPSCRPIIAQAGPPAAERAIEFFTAKSRNPNTQRAYGRAADVIRAELQPAPSAPARPTDAFEASSGVTT